MASENSDQNTTQQPKIDLRKVSKPDRELPPADSPVAEAEIFRSRVKNADSEIEELREQIEDLKEKRESNRDRWHRNLDRATDDMLQREGAIPVDGNGVLDYSVNGARVQIESLSEDSIQFTLYSSDSPLEPNQVREAENLAELIERELSSERQKIENRQSKIEAADEYKSILEEQFNDVYASREVVKELYDGRIVEKAATDQLEGDRVYRQIAHASMEVDPGHKMRDKIKNFHGNTDLEPEECAFIALNALRDEMGDLLDSPIMSVSGEGRLNKADYVAASDGNAFPGGIYDKPAKEFLEEIYDQLDVSESDFKDYSPREIVNEITKEGCTEIVEVLDGDWTEYDNPLKRAEEFVDSVEEYLESIGYQRDTLNGIPYERAEEIVDRT